MIGTRTTLAAFLLLASGLIAAAVAGFPRQPVRATPPTAEALVLADEKGKASPPKELGDEQTVEITGRVLDPDGKPVAGADVGLGTDRKPDKEAKPIRTTTGADGTFRLSARAGTDPERGIKVVASAKGFGLDWVDVKRGTKKVEVRLQLVKDDVPIDGRVLDLEGNPIAGAAIHVSYLEKRVDEADLGPWIERFKAMSRLQGIPGEPPTKPLPPAVPMSGLWPGSVEMPARATTDRIGRFRLTGFGRERILHLIIEAVGIEYQSVMVMSRAGVEKVQIEAPILYGAKFTHLCRPSRPLVGTVRDRKTGKPLAGIAVAAHATPDGRMGRFPNKQTVTDENGKFRIDGIGKHALYMAAAEGTPYFNVTTWSIKDVPGLEPVVVDFELERGVTIRGKLTDKATGRPVRGRVFWEGLPDNPNLKDFATVRPNAPRMLLTRGGDTAADGSFFLTAVPGPGLLFVEAADTNRFARAPAAADDALIRHAAKLGRATSSYHAVLHVTPSEKEPKSLVCDIALEPGVSRGGTVLGPDGKPVTGVLAGGLSMLPQFGSPLPLMTSEFKVTGLSADTPRPALFYHPEKNLSKLILLKGDDKGPIEVRLEAIGTATGRLLDANGRPLARTSVTLKVNRSLVLNRDMPPEFLGGSNPLRPRSQSVRTDGEGRFQVEGLVPGARYDLSTDEAGSVEGVLVKRGDKGPELGDVKLKPFSTQEKE